MRVFRWLGLVTLACAALGFAGCAQQRAPINRVQAFALSKHFFVGPNLSDQSDNPEFYMAHRIIDEPYGVGQGFWMFQSTGGLARVIFEIQENVLIARLSYERIQNTQFNGVQTSTNGQFITDGQVVAEWNITSHFDIIHDYNLQTGEQLNVIVENTTDRPWYEREYFRVDWSKNLDLSIFKRIPITEGIRLEFRFEAFNVTNTPVWGLPANNLNGPNFGVVSSTANTARQLQFGLKFYF